MNLEQSAAIRIAINDTLNQLRPPVMGAGLSEPTCAALHTHLVALLKEELRALTGQALEGNLTDKPGEPTLWYPDDSGEWVEGHPRDLPPDTLMAGWLFMAEREAKNYTIPESAWPAKELTNPNIVAYKVVKP